MSTLDELVCRRARADSAAIAHAARDAGLIDQPIEAVDGARVRIHGTWLLNFASSGYLGLNDDARVLAAARRAGSNALSLSMPPWIGSAAITEQVEAAIARLAREQAALVFPSTNHAARDALALLAGDHGPLLLDRRAYPISVDAAYAAARGERRVRWFAHNDADDLEQTLRRLPNRRDAVIVCDGVYPAEGVLAPLPELLAVAERHAATVYVDDAHGIGVLGEQPKRSQPWGVGGGGTPRHLGVECGRIAQVGSLSKAYGVPLAFVAGPHGFIAALRLLGGVRIHNSAPSIPVLAAALAALSIGTAEGDARRQRVIALAQRFRMGLRSAGLPAASGKLLPIQSVPVAAPGSAWRAATELRRRGIWPLVQLDGSSRSSGGTLRFVLTAAHAPGDIDAAVTQLVSVLG